MEIKFNINDRTAKTLKTLTTGKGLAVCMLLLMVLSSAITFSAVTIPHTFQSGDVISADEVNQNFQALKAKIDFLEANASSVPVGTIAAFGGTPDKVPAGWAICKGDSLSRTAYAELFAVIDINWGSMDSSSFSLPDLRGLTLRGVDMEKVRDLDSDKRTRLHEGDPAYINGTAGNFSYNVGSYQTDAFQGHWHNVATYTSGSGNRVVEFNGSAGLNKVDFAHDPVTDKVNGAPRTAIETRMKNAAVYYIIKVTK
jgi:microcystin-dependent protein